MAVIYAKSVTIEINGQVLDSISAATDIPAEQLLEELPVSSMIIEGEYREVEPTPEAKLLNAMAKYKKQGWLWPEELRAWLEEGDQWK